MNIEEIREYCLSLQGTTECFPFDAVTLVFKVMGKMFCLMNLDGETGLSLKNTPEKIVEMREEYFWVLPAYHMNKMHWYIIRSEGVPGDLLRQFIIESYDAVVQRLTKKQKEELKRCH